MGESSQVLPNHSIVGLFLSAKRSVYAERCEVVGVIPNLEAPDLGRTDILSRYLPRANPKKKTLTAGNLKDSARSMYETSFLNIFLSRY